MSMGYGPEFQKVLRPKTDVTDYPEPLANDGAIPLLHAILQEIKQQRLMGERPTLSQFNLSPDAAQSPSGRLLLPQANRYRLSELVIFAISAMTFTLYIGESPEYFFPAIVSGTTVIQVPIAIVLERGQTMQLRSTAATWVGWALGWTE